VAVYYIHISLTVPPYLLDPFTSAAMSPVRRFAPVRTLVALALVFAAALPLRAQPGNTIPDRLTDVEYWNLISELSEPPGNFRSENLVSNETAFQWVLQPLTQVKREGMVYMGVAPEQNFTYIAAIKPKMAIIVDVRQGNKMEHLLYKALFELSADRGEFVSLLFSKPRPRGIDSTTTVDSIMNAYWYVNTDTAMYRRNKEAVRRQLMTVHGFKLTDGDWIDLVWVYDQFYLYGPGGLTYNSGTSNAGGMPSYAEIIMARDQQGINRGFLASETTFRWLKDFQSRNMLVPVIGNFAGPKAIPAVGRWLKAHNATVTAIYASNVEQYLWQDGIAYTYYNNIAQLPIDANSVWIRSNGARGTGGGNGMSAPNVVCSVQRLLAENRAGNINSYASIFNYCY
jgi:hypothetical protein